MNLHIPEFGEVFAALKTYSVEFGGPRQPIEAHLQQYRSEAVANRQKDALGIFKIFACALLERQVTGANYLRRRAAMEAAIGSFEDVSEEGISEVLRGSGYRWKPQGTGVILRLKERVLQNDFEWERYFRKAEEACEDGFESDELLSWDFVKNKVRDFALSEFSRYFCVIDSRVRNVLCRTGLICHGFGDPDISYGPSYSFCRRLLHQASRESGWPDSQEALAPGDIDRMFWLFAQDRCGAKPACEGCPLEHICCTGIRRARD